MLEMTTCAPCKRLGFDVCAVPMLHDPEIITPQESAERSCSTVWASSMSDRPRSESSKRVIYVISDCTVCHGTGLLDAIVQGRGVQVFCACVITQRAPREAEQ